MNFKRIIAVILMAFLVVNIVGCNKKTDNTSSQISSAEESVERRDYLTLLYSMSDSFNPYAVETAVNRQLCQLIYEPLVKLDNSFNPVYCLAKDVVIDGTSCIVTVNAYKFSDGSTVSAEDVVYSYNLAKSTTTSFAAKLYAVQSATASDSATVVFKLSKADPFFANVLNFPIIKAGSEKISNADSVLQPPIGSGRYKVNENKDGVVQNDNYHGERSSIKQIKLINAPDTDSVSHYAQVGAADMYYNDISDGTILRMSGKKLDINLNNLVYIGINQNYGALAENALRQALSSGIDRKKLCQNVYYNNALPANGFFNPVWQAVKSVQNIQIEAKSEITIENLEKIGYNRLDSKGLRANINGIPLKLTLLVNSENRTKVTAAQLIASQLLDYGISITVVEKPYEQYMQSLVDGNFQLYLGEIKLTENMDISSMVVEGGNAAFGLAVPKENVTVPDIDATLDEGIVTETETSKTAGEVVAGFYAGQNTITDIASVLQSEMPFIPLCYRTGALFYNDNIENVNNSSESDIYFSIESYNYKE